MRRPAWSSCGTWSSRTRSRRSKAGTPRSTATETSPRSSWPAQVAASVKVMAASASPTRQGAPRPCARATCWCWCASAALFDAVIRALKDAGIAVAGADRLMLTEHIAVMDLMVLADALLLPEDDLALATVLKSPCSASTSRLVRARLERAGACGMCCAAGRRRSRLLPSRGDARPLGRRRPAPLAVRLLCRRARRRSRPRPHSAAARAGSERCARRVPQSRARLRARETPSLQGFVAWLRATRRR